MPKTPPAGTPHVGRTPTPTELEVEIGKLRADLAALRRSRPAEWYTSTVERHDEAINKWLVPLAQRLPGQLDSLAHSIGLLAQSVAAVDGAATTMQAAAADLRTSLRDHDDRLLAVEERSARSHVRLDTLDDQQLDTRLRAVEQHAAAANTELALTRRQKGGVAALGTVSGALAALLSRLLGG